MRKRIKRIAALAVLAVITAAGMNAYAKDDNAVSSKAELYLKRLNILGIMSETEDTSKVLTRGEMAKIVCGVGNYNIIGADEKVFADVPRDYVYADYINTAYTFGIIDGTGDNTFSPDETVTREQMYKMLLCTAGYQKFGEMNGGYPAGYVTLASSNNIIMPGAEGEVTVAEAAYSVFKTLEMPVVRADYKGALSYGDKEDTLLNDLLDEEDMTISEGVLTFDGYTYLSGSGTPDTYYAAVDGQRISNDGTQLDGLIGRYIEYFTKENRMVAAYEYPGKNSAVTFTADAIDKVNGLNSYSVYTDTNKKTNFRLAKSPYLVYNQQGVAGLSESELIPLYGDVTLIDNNDDGSYEVVLINSREYFVVDDASTTGLSVQYKKYGTQTQNGYRISESELNDTVYYTVTDGEGKILDPSAIGKNSVVGVAKSPDGSIMNVVVTKKMFEGTLTALSGTQLTVDGEVYGIMTDRDGNGMKFDVSMGDFVSVYLNENDQVVYCETETGNNDKYAYISRVYRGDDGESLYVKAVMCGKLGSLTNRKYWWVKDKMAYNDSIQKYEISSKAKIDGEKQTENKVYGLLGQIVQFKISEDDKITDVDVLEPEFEYTDGKYNHNTGAMIQNNLEDTAALDYDNPAVLLVGNINTLVVPKTVGSEHSEDEYLAKYRIENDSANYNIAFYDIPDGSQTPRLLVLKEALTEAGTAQDDASCGILTSNLRSATDEDGEQYYEVDMYTVEGNTRTVQIRDDAKRTDSSIKTSINDLEKGDVVEFSWDSKGKANIVHIIASAKSPVDRMQMGVVEKVQKNVIWNKSDGGDFYNLFYYINPRGERVEAGVRADYAVFKYDGGYVEKIETADIVTDPDGIDGDTVIIAGKIAVIIPID